MISASAAILLAAAILSGPDQPLCSQIDYTAPAPTFSGAGLDEWHLWMEGR